MVANFNTRPQENTLALLVAKKISLNNKLRRHLKSLQAVRKLNDDNPVERVAAIEAIMKAQDKSLQSLIVSRQDEKNKEVLIAKKMHWSSLILIPPVKRLVTSSRNLDSNVAKLRSIRNNIDSSFDQSSCLRVIETIFFGLSGLYPALAAIGLSITF